MSINHDWQDKTNWDDSLRAAVERGKRGLTKDQLPKFRRHVNEMKHLTTDQQLGEFTLIYGLGGEVDVSLVRALKVMRIYIGSER